ncbi:MAG: hypothetical protein HRT54_05835 [Colwellia sp.]|nr:hypothetical protein [Colwellia sp.]
MNIEVNGMKYLGSSEFYLHTIRKYLTIVYCEDISTGHKKEYAEILDSHADRENIVKIMDTGFKPYLLNEWLNECLNT